MPLLRTRLGSLRYSAVSIGSSSCDVALIGQSGSESVPQSPTPSRQPGPVPNPETLEQEEGRQSRPVRERTGHNPGQCRMSTHEDEKVPSSPIDGKRAPRHPRRPRLVRQSHLGEVSKEPARLLQPSEQIPILKVGEVEFIEQAHLVERLPAERGCGPRNLVIAIGVVLS